MKLKDKTYRKFINFFEKTSKKFEENEFEIAYSEIQRETGVASITLKKAIQILENDGVILVNPGRNTRYAKFQYLLSNGESKELTSIGNDNELMDNDEINIQELIQQNKGLSNHVEQLRQRVRTQEMAISGILDRLAELEDKIRR